MTLVINTWDKGEKISSVVYEKIKTIHLPSPKCISLQYTNNRRALVEIDFDSMDIVIIQ